MSSFKIYVFEKRRTFCLYVNVLSCSHLSSEISKDMALNSTTRNIPCIKTIQSWRADFPWLIVDSNGMKCKLCCEWQDKITSVKNFSDVFIKGSQNYHADQTL